MAETNLREILRLPNVQVVVLGMTWSDAELVESGGSAVSNSGKAEALVEAVIDLVARIEATGRAVVMMGPIPTPGVDLASIMSRKVAFGWTATADASITRADFDREFGPVIVLLEKRLGDGWVQAHRAICTSDLCHYIHTGRSMFADSNHIAVAELERFAPLFQAPLCTVRQSRGRVSECG